MNGLLDLKCLTKYFFSFPDPLVLMHIKLKLFSCVLSDTAVSENSTFLSTLFYWLALDAFIKHFYKFVKLFWIYPFLFFQKAINCTTHRTKIRVYNRNEKSQLTLMLWTLNSKTTSCFWIRRKSVVTNFYPS
jgi:hypothetical protein